MIIDITDTAKAELKNVIERKKTDKPLRIFVAGYGWGGPSFGLALDELKTGDEQIQVDNFTFLVEDALHENYGKFTVDYSNDWLRRGFTIIPDRGGASC